MDMHETDITASLNEAQYEAVTTESQNTLVLAGAGSGKTRVLVQRIAWLVNTKNVSLWSILAVTFTNKAAKEMRGRLETLLNVPTQKLWVGTFHGLAHRILRANWEKAGLPQNFQIIDSQDQQTMIKRIMREKQLDEQRWPPRQAQWWINEQKDKGLRPQHIELGADLWLGQMVRIYESYEQQCRQAGLVDFAEMLLRAHELWRDNPDLLTNARERFSHILVDEFQDTNTVQYAWLRLLAGDTGHTFVVGDDDQSVYGWRGAQVENIRNFVKDFPNTETIRLEQNYRSTATILDAANALIQNNAGRMGKELWTNGSEGEPIQLYSAFNDLDEARFVAEQVQAWGEEGGARAECAVLYRSNAQSRVLEEALLAAQIPYRIYGGLRFFERAEIKDALAYLRLISHRHDDGAFERIVNQPTRGIGDRTLDIVRDYARTTGVSLWQASLEQIQTGTELNARAKNALAAFLNMIDETAHQCENLKLGEQVEVMLRNSSLQAHFEQQKGDAAQGKVENLKELVTAAKEFSPADDVLSPLDEFLAQAALEAGEGQADEWEDCVQLMTLHSAKGLEFPQVFLTGMEEGLFPHYNSAEQPDKLEEERRLCYVGITRARQKLTITHAESRRLYGKEHYPRVSRFVKEIPTELMQEVRLRGNISRPVAHSRSASSSSGYGSYGTQNRISAANTQKSPATRRVQPKDTGTGLQAGQNVSHPKFGNGTVLQIEGTGAQARVQVRFDGGAGTKWLVAGYANLSPV